MAGYTVKTREEVPDVLGDYPGEMRFITYEVGAEQVAVTYRRMPQHTGSKGSYGHRHKEQEEIYLVVAGSGRVKLDDEVIELRQWDALRLPPEIMRNVEAGPEGVELIAFGAPKLASPQADVEMTPNWWAD